MKRMKNLPRGTQQLSQLRTKKHTAVHLSKELFYFLADKEYQLKEAAGWRKRTFPRSLS